MIPANHQFSSTRWEPPSNRRFGPFSRPHRRHGINRWAWQGRGLGSPILAPGDPFLDEAAFLARKTPSKLTETELLSAFNYLDQEALQAFEGIGPAIANNIVKERQAYQYFSSLDEIASVPRIGPKRFQLLAGRALETDRFRLHDLMRRSRKDDITLEDLQPWLKPAPGVDSIFLLPASAPKPEISPTQTLLSNRLRQGRLYFIVSSDANTSGGRAARVRQQLPRILRPIIHERSFSTTH